MAAVAPAAVAAEAGYSRALVAKILPAAHGVKPKTWANILSQFRGALRLAGVIDGCRRARHAGPRLGSPGQGHSRRQEAVLRLGTFLQLVRQQAIAPGAVDDAVVLRFLASREQTDARRAARRGLGRNTDFLDDEADNERGLAGG